MSEAVMPKIFQIATTVLDEEGVIEALKALEASEWKSSSSDPHAVLVEFAGKLCYRSFNTDVNKNLTKVRNDNYEFIENLQKQRHGSVFEHAYVTILLVNVSRVLTHELVRHRICNYSQESMRFVRTENLKYYLPKFADSGLSVEECDTMADIFDEAYINAEKLVASINKLLSVDDMSFGDKKKITSSIRRLIPMGVTTNILFTANHRMFRHMITQRTAAGAEEEIREIFHAIALHMYNAHPNVYQDIGTVPVEDSDIPAVVFKNGCF